MLSGAVGRQKKCRRTGRVVAGRRSFKKEESSYYLGSAGRLAAVFVSLL